MKGVESFCEGVEVRRVGFGSEEKRKKREIKNDLNFQIRKIINEAEKDTVEVNQR